MKSIVLNDVIYPHVVINWIDIVGDCTTVAGDEFRELKCAEITTEGYLFDMFEENNQKFIRTFASYQDGISPAFGDRNIFPLSVLTKESFELVKSAIEYSLLPFKIDIEIE